MRMLECCREDLAAAACDDGGGGNSIEGGTLAFRWARQAGQAPEFCSSPCRLLLRPL